MKARFIQCELCKKEIPLESCELATYCTVIEGKEYVFCCEACARSYREKRKEQHTKRRQVSGE
jgi:YHS domain-containing protein